MDKVNQKAVRQALQLLQHPEEASRNQSFDHFSHFTGKRALRFYRQIKSLEEEFKTSKGCGSFEAGSIPENMVEVRFTNPILRYTRICYLPPELFAWLADRLVILGHPRMALTN